MFQVLIFVMLLLGSVLANQDKINLGVSDFDARGLTKDESLIITDRIRSELIKTNKYKVMERSRMEEILKEQGFQVSGACSSSDCQIQMGQLLGIEQIITGEVGKFGELYTLSARVMDVASGEIIASYSVDYEGEMEGLLKSSVPKLVNQIDKSQEQSSNQEQAKQAVQSLSTQPDEPGKFLGLTYKTHLQIGLGIAGGALAYLGYLQDAKMKDVNERIKVNQDQYRNADTDFTLYYAQAEALNDEFDSEQLKQQIFYASSGLAFAGLIITIAF